MWKGKESSQALCQVEGEVDGEDVSAPPMALGLGLGMATGCDRAEVGTAGPGRVVPLWRLNERKCLAVSKGLLSSHR